MWHCYRFLSSSSVVPTSAPYSYFISVLLLSEKHAGEARKSSSKATFFRISWSTASKNIFLDSEEKFWPWGVLYLPISGLTLGRKHIGRLGKWHALQGSLFDRGSVNNCSKFKLLTTLTTEDTTQNNRNSSHGQDTNYFSTMYFELDYVGQYSQTSNSLTTLCTTSAGSKLFSRVDNSTVVFHIQSVNCFHAIIFSWPTWNKTSVV